MKFRSIIIFFCFINACFLKEKPDPQIDCNCFFSDESKNNISVCYWPKKLCEINIEIRDTSNIDPLLEVYPIVLKSVIHGQNITLVVLEPEDSLSKKTHDMFLNMAKKEFNNDSSKFYIKNDLYGFSISKKEAYDF